MTTNSVAKAPKAIGQLESSIGILYVFSMTLGLQSGFHKEVGQSFTECDPLYLVRMLSMFVCYPKDSLLDDEMRPKEVVLTREDVEKLTEDDIEHIARIYTEGNDYLFRKSIRKETKSSEGHIIVSSEKGDVEFPREEDESYVQYLSRLLKHQEEKFVDQFKKLAEPFKNFSDSLKSSIGATLAWGQSLKKSLPDSAKAEIRIAPQAMPDFDLAELQRNIEQNRLTPFNELSTRLEQLIEMTGQATDFQIQTNEVQTRIAEELKMSGDAAANYSRRSISLNWIVIIITAIGVLLSGYMILLSKTDSFNNSNAVMNKADEITKELKGISAGLSAVIGKRSEQETSARSTAASRDQERLERLIAAQHQVIRELQAQRNQQTQKLKELEEKITRILEEKSPDK
jgi:hypothetical protein